jgi:hypothetical protein
MDPGSQRESEALRRAFRIRLNETDGTLQNADETCLASVAQVLSNACDGCLVIYMACLPLSKMLQKIPHSCVPLESM